MEAVIDTLTLSDIACPTWGVSDPFYTTCDGSVYLTATYGAPYNPVILVPTEVLSIDPTWAACTKVPSNGPFLLPCGVYDPPRALQAQEGLAPTPVNGVPASKDPGSNSGNSKDQTDRSPASNLAPANPQPAPANFQPPPTAVADPAKAVDNHPAAAAVVPVAQTTINLGGGAGGGQGGSGQGSGGQGSGAQASPGIGSIINSAVGGGPPAAAAPAAAVFTPHVITAQGQTLSITDPSAVVVAGHTLSVGGPAISTGTNFFSLAPNGNLVAGTLAPAPAVLIFGSSTITANSASAFLLAGQTLTPGGSITVSGTPIALPFNANAAIIAGSTQPFLTTPPTNPTIINAPPLLTFNSATYTANAAGAFVIAGKTLTPGGSIIVSGTPISEASGSSPAFAVVGSETQSLAAASVITTLAPVLTFNDQLYTANAASEFFISGHTLTPGGVITVNGTPLSEVASGAATDYVVVGSSTEILSSSATITPADIFTVGGEVFTANPSGFVLDGTTLFPGGPAATISGTPVSLQSGGVLDIGSSRVPLPSETAPMTFKGAATRMRLRMSCGVVVYLVVALVAAMPFVVL